MEGFKFEEFNKKKEPIVEIDIDIDKIDEELLERWKEMEEVLDDTVEGLEDLLVESDDKFSLHPLNFEATSEYDPEKDKEEEKLRTKIILHYAFQELDFNPKNPKIIKEIVEEEKRIRYFETNRPNIQLGYDEIDWWLELIKERGEQK